jgi:hypothetical protein
MPSLTTLHDERQDLLLARADRTADAAERVVRRVWLDLLAAIREGGAHVRTRCAAILRQLPHAAAIVAQDLAGVAQDSARWTARHVAAELTAEQRERVLRGRVLPTGIYPKVESLFEDERGQDDPLLVGLILPTLTGDQVNAVLRDHGWFDRIQKLTRLANPDTLAARIGALMQAGESIQKIAREIRPLVQGVQTSARRVARTAGLFIAHEAELATYEGLAEMIEGYTIHAVRDHATRPEHLKRDGTKYYRNPKPGQRGLDEMPRPPREADGTWAFNCRCWLSPLLSG